MVVAGGDVDPTLLGADPALTFGEVGGIGLIGADLLSGDDEIEVERDVTPRLAEQLVVDVGDLADRVLLGHLHQGRIGLPKRLPAHHRIGQEA